MDWTPRTFEDLLPLIQHALDGMEASPAVLHPMRILEVLSGDDAGSEVDDACRLFAKSGAWPSALPDHHRLAIAFRLRCARWYCSDIGQQPVGEETAGEILLGILTTYWHDAGRFDWIQEDVLGGDYTPPE